MKKRISVAPAQKKRKESDTHGRKILAEPLGVKKKVDAATMVSFYYILSRF